MEAHKVYPRDFFIFEMYIYIYYRLRKMTYNFTLALSSLNFVRLFF